MNFRDKAIKHNSFVAHEDWQRRLRRECSVSGEIYEVLPGRTTLTLHLVQGMPVSSAD